MALSLMSVFMLEFFCTQVLAQSPVISHVSPEFPSTQPHIVTGEGFAAPGLEVWTWGPPSTEESILESVPGLEGYVDLPATPPEGAKQAELIDVEDQVLVTHLAGNLVWLKRGDAYSPPHLLNVAKPHWISSEQAHAGDLLHIFGLGLRVPYHQTRIALVRENEAILLEPIAEARSPRTTDSYLIYFQLPADLAVSHYTVYVHNGMGGAYGWQVAGQIAIAARSEQEEQIVNVLSLGAKGDGLADDTSALRTAIDSLLTQGGGVLFFPPGVYRVEETLDIPSGITLQGAHRDSSIIKGFGFDPTVERRMWYASTDLPASVLRLSSETSMHSLTVSGFTSRGEGGYGLVELMPQPEGNEVHDVVIEGCRIESLGEHPTTSHWLYRCGFAVLQESQRIRLLNNDITGTIQFATTSRTEIIGNTLRGGTVNEVCTMRGRGIECLVDGNRLVDTPGRMAFYPLWHTYIRYNEIHQAFRGTWANAEEVYLVHGGSSKTVSSPTECSAQRLVDAAQQWEPGGYRGATVLITSGRGFGQYRRVIENGPTTLVLDRPWLVAPDSTSEYVVGLMLTENVFFANLNNTPCRLSLWLDCVSNVVDKHRDVFAGGVDVWGQDRSNTSKKGEEQQLHRFHPSYYNMLLDCWLDGSPVKLVSGASPDNAYKGIPLFGTHVAKNRIRQPHMRRTGFAAAPHAEGGILVGGGSGRMGTSHTILAGNFMAFSNIGVNVSQWARKTFVLGNEFQEVDTPVLDLGSQTVRQGNRIHTIEGMDDRQKHQRQ